MSLQGIYFLDIETVSEHDPSAIQYTNISDFYKKKFERSIREEFAGFDPEAVSLHYEKNSGLYAEFGKIVAISIGTMKATTAGDKFYIKSLTGRHEKALLEAFRTAIEKAMRICGHNLKEFDAPYLIRRMWANEISLPSILNHIGKKPWEVPYLDTLEMWGAGQFKYRCGLDLLCNVLGIPSSKTDISGADVGKLYWSMFDGLPDDQLPFEKEEAVLKQIGTYCNGDVLADAQVYCKLMGLPLIKEEQIVYL